MNIVSLHCQMGNQMFQYAFSLGLKGWTLPFCSTCEYPFKLNCFRLSWVLRFIYNHPWIAKQYRRLCRWMIHDKITDDDGRRMITPSVGSHYYEGYFQSEDYFRHSLPSIRKAFSIRKEFQEIFIEKYGDFFHQCKTLAVHLRRTDYAEEIRQDMIDRFSPEKIASQYLDIYKELLD